MGLESVAARVVGWLPARPAYLVHGVRLTCKKTKSAPPPLGRNFIPQFAGLCFITAGAICDLPSSQTLHTDQPTEENYKCAAPS